MPLATAKRGERMLGWVGDIEQETLENGTFRTVVFTGQQTQLTVMSLEPGESIGREVHEGIDQFLRVERGSGRVELGRSEDTVDETHEVTDDWAVIVPAGVWHDLVNTGDGELKLYSLYSPPEHPDGTVHETKAEAEAAEQAEDESTRMIAGWRVRATRGERREGRALSVWERCRSRHRRRAGDERRGAYRRGSSRSGRDVLSRADSGDGPRPLSWSAS
jgi:mannose-6-phosphate isomerase-like protein (cupin superfamily)